jgi:hypothetical protein
MTRRTEKTMTKLWPKKINIVAAPDPHAENGVTFHMEDQNGDELETLVFNKDQEPGMKKDEHHEVRFKLIQESGMTLEFAQSPSDALWVAWGTRDTYPACPQTKPAQKDTIFYATKSNANTLTAINTNPTECLFSFSLNFVDPHSSTPTKLIPYDPGGGNQDGGEPPFIGGDISASTGTVRVIALAVGVLAIAFVAFRLLS